MTVLAIVHPTDLVATDLREKLNTRRDLWQRPPLFALDKDEVGTLSEVRGRPALVTALEEDSFEKVDVAFLFGPMAEAAADPGDHPPRTTIILTAPDAGPGDGHPVVIGIEEGQLPAGQPLLSPHPAVIGLAHLIHGLARFEPKVAAATVFQPASILGKEALEELFEQTREVLNFEPPTKKLLSRQFAFNIFDAGDPGGPLEQQLARVLEPQRLDLSIAVLRAGIFHGYGISLHVRLAEDPGIAELRAALSEQPLIEVAEKDELLGTLDVAAHENLLVGRIERASPGIYRIWALVDNLTRGGATNVLGIFEALRAPVF